MTASVYLVFSGHNDRAVVALCRSLHFWKQRFVIVSSGPSDRIYETRWAEHVAYCRTDRRVDVELFRQICRVAEEKHGRNQPLIYCPTTEFINQFLLEHRNECEDAGLTLSLPAATIYHSLTGKLTSQKYIQDLTGIAPPQRLRWSEAEAPCVFKPKVNIIGSAVAYPRICIEQADAAAAMTELNPDAWFVQEWVSGQSFYFCAYLSRDGRTASFWQENLVQQPGGKSIVLARSCSNPGVPTERLLAGLLDLGYFGPLMLEVIRNGSGTFKYIEINPRFWGPLQLALTACPRLLRLFIEDTSRQNLPADDPPPNPQSWYAWAYGARTKGCHFYPAATAIAETDSIDLLTLTHDVYAHDDTRALHATH